MRARTARRARWTVEPSAFLALSRPGSLAGVPFEVADDEGGPALYLTSLLSCRDGLVAPVGEVELLWKSTREVDLTLAFTGTTELSVTAE